MGSGAAVILMRRAKELQDRFNAKGAISPATAKTLAQLGLDTKTPAFQMCVAKNYIGRIGDKYYFDSKRFQNRPVRRLKDSILGLFK